MCRASCRIQFLIRTVTCTKTLGCLPTGHSSRCSTGECSYWESHEAWEHLWIELGRTTTEARAVQGLIKLAACGVKCLEGNATGAGRHAGRAVELLANECDAELFGNSTLRHAREIASTALQSPSVLKATSDGAPIVLTGFQL
jgi:hypothetical protein